jgi:hypothetical protein
MNNQNCSRLINFLRMKSPRVWLYRIVARWELVRLGFVAAVLSLHTSEIMAITRTKPVKIPSVFAKPPANWRIPRKLSSPPTAPPGDLQMCC